MASSKKDDHGNPPSADEAPIWADGLKKLYDSVVDEPLPDSFKDLLAQLDDSDDTASSHEDGGDKA